MSVFLFHGLQRDDGALSDTNLNIQTRKTIAFSIELLQCDAVKREETSLKFIEVCRKGASCSLFFHSPAFCIRPNDTHTHT